MSIAPGILKLSRSVGATCSSSPKSTLRSCGARRLIKMQGYKHFAPPEQLLRNQARTDSLVQAPTQVKYSSDNSEL
jgi:hypothetical protein